MKIVRTNRFEIFFARHGDAENGADKRYGGSADFSLSDLGLSQANTLRERALDLDLNLILSSPLRRAKQTAQIVAQDRVDAKTVQLEDLQEWNSYGVLSGLTQKEATELFPDIMYSVEGRPECTTRHILGAEPHEAFRRRVKRCFNQILTLINDNPSKRPLVIFHGKFLQYLTTNILELDDKISYRPALLQTLHYNRMSCSIEGSLIKSNMGKEKPTSMNIYLVRHGEAEDDITEAYGGVADHPLTALGKEQALMMANNLRDSDIARIYTSPLKRAVSTAIAMTEVFGLPDAMQVVDDLCERNSYGVLSGVPKAEAWKLFPRILKEGEVRSGYDKTPLPGSEDFTVFLDRVQSVFSEIVANAKSEGIKDIALVSHGTFLKALVTEHLALKLPEDWKHASVILLKYQPPKATIFQP